MKNLYLGICQFVNDEEGVTAIEYALIAALIAVVITVAATSLGKELNNIFTSVCKSINNNTACA